jgi:hypothetical protein
MLEKEPDRDILVPGPFRGTMTPHTRIPLHQGICGAAAPPAKPLLSMTSPPTLATSPAHAKPNPKSSSPSSFTAKSLANSISTLISSPPLAPMTVSSANMPPRFSASSSRNPFDLVHFDSLLAAGFSVRPCGRSQSAKFWRRPIAEPKRSNSTPVYSGFGLDLI